MQTLSPTEPPRVRMDPRIKQRRIQVRRDEGRRRLRVLAAAVAVASLVAAGVGASHSALLDVDHVQVTGLSKVSKADVVRAAGLDHHRFMVQVDPGSTAARVRRVPWIASAKVVRQWPGTVRISVVERSPLVALPAPGGQAALIDHTGRVLADLPSVPAGIIRVDGAEPAPAPGRRVSGGAASSVAVAAALPDDIRSRVQTVALLPGGDVELQLVSPPATVIIGQPDALPAKMVALSTILTRVDLRELGMIDLRVPGAPVLTRDGAKK